MVLSSTSSLSTASLLSLPLQTRATQTEEEEKTRRERHGEVKDIIKEENTTRSLIQSLSLENTQQLFLFPSLSIRLCCKRPDIVKRELRVSAKTKREGGSIIKDSCSQKANYDKSLIFMLRVHGTRECICAAGTVKGKYDDKKIKGCVTYNTNSKADENMIEKKEERENGKESS